jgi:hypothetical protein
LFRNGRAVKLTARVGSHLTATLNGQRIHNNAVLPAMTGGALDNDELAPGPIMIQGDHRACHSGIWW